MSCERYDERLTLLATGEPDDEAEAHVAGCQRCAGELRSLRALFGQVRTSTPPVPPLDERAGQDFRRGVRLAYHEAARRPGWRWVWGSGLAAAAAVLLAWFAVGRFAPAVAPTPVVAAVPQPRVPEPEDLEELDEDSLTAVLAALDEGDDEGLTPGDLAEVVESLSSDELAAVVETL